MYNKKNIPSCCQDKCDINTNTNENTLEFSKIDEINEYFKMPISYNKKKVELNKNIITDLELISPVDASSNPIYSFCFNNREENMLSKKVMTLSANYYTTDVTFLKDTQQLLKEYKPFSKKNINAGTNDKIETKYKNILDIWNELKIENGFKEKYYYIDWDILEFLNKSELFLQFMSIYNLISPILSLFVPILILLIPFFIIKAKGLDITMSEYIEVLKIVATQNAIGKLFTVNFAEIGLQEKAYIIISAAFYLFSIYQNVMVCIRFHNNMINIHNNFQVIKHYLENTISSMENYLVYSLGRNSYEAFNDNLIIKIEILREIQTKLSSISKYSLFNISKIHEIGHILKYFYELHSSSIYEDAIMYSFGFNGYIDCIEGLQQNIEEGKMNYASFISDTKKTVFKNGYYACLKDGSPIKNTVKFKKNMIITGPNASGKTTILKSSLINIIFTQQFGCGFYDSADIAPFDHIHCYLNIPDTSGRDSLFQAEARRCKEILDIIKENANGKHFCAFDELYSGTNPEEAVISASAFMKYLIKNQNVSCLLTTHYMKLCKKLAKNKNIKNYNMKTIKKSETFLYTYLLEEGISEVRGGIKVLQDMNYPKEILENAK
jgi:hypothetical protein